MNSITNKNERPVKILQFGEGNFLRAFVDYMVDIANEKGVYNGSVAIVQPIDFPLNPAFAEQNFNYTVLLRGKEQGQVVNDCRVVSSVSDVFSVYRDFERFLSYASCETLEAVVSNTTEAGITLDENDKFDAAPPATYPGKLTRFLFERFKAFGGDSSKGLVIYPVELIEDNGKKLRSCVLRLAEVWGLGDEFIKWVESSCMFCSTLVDRIVTGYPKTSEEQKQIADQLGYEDRLVDICEPFGLWVIEADDPARAEATLPLNKADLPVIFTDNQRPYRERKVRILNGAHTSFVPAAFIAGQDIVRDCMADADIRKFIDTCIYEEILPTLTLPKEDVAAFAAAVCERFENPFIDHALISICLNSISKWKARVLPSLLDSFKANGKLPTCLTMSFATLCAFYSTGKKTADGFTGSRTVDGAEQIYTILDSAEVIEFFAENNGADDLPVRLAAKEDFWGQDLTAIPGFSETVMKWYSVIKENGSREAMRLAVNA
ncbi:MAG: tagaturonate reductase [Ruminococcaceae bacterium]|nr:tagaturonate reductase [Oscillospiraceae bacterium]